MDADHPFRGVLLPRLFTLGAEDLACGQATEADRTRGLGFGLAVARSLLEAHGGALRLEALPGVGARAWLTLPRECVVA